MMSSNLTICDLTTCDLTIYDLTICDLGSLPGLDWESVSLSEREGRGIQDMSYTGLATKVQEGQTYTCWEHI